MSGRRTGFLEYLHHPLVKRRFLKSKVNVKMKRKGNENVPMRSLDELWVFYCPPRQLREGITEGIDALCLHFEAGLLRH
jgi:hypothetical protein